MIAILCRPGQPNTVDVVLGERLSGYLVTRNNGSVPPEHCVLLVERRRPWAPATASVVEVSS